MSIINRKDIRHALATALASAMPSAQGNVFGFMKTGFEGDSPIVRIVDSGSDRPYKEQRGVRSRFYYSVQLFVLYFEDGSPEIQSNAEDLLDDLEHEFYSYLADNQTTTNWTMIGYDDGQRSRVIQVRLGESRYILEDIPIAVRVDG